MKCLDFTFAIGVHVALVGSKHWSSNSPNGRSHARRETLLSFRKTHSCHCADVIFHWGIAGNINRSPINTHTTAARVRFVRKYFVIFLMSHAICDIYAASHHIKTTQLNTTTKKNAWNPILLITTSIKGIFFLGKS